MARRASTVDEGLEKFAGAFRSGFEGFAKLVAGGENAPPSHGQYVRLSDFIRRLEPDKFSGVLEILDRYGAPYFPPSAPVEMLKELPVQCARELLACVDHGMLGSQGALPSGGNGTATAVAGASGGGGGEAGSPGAGSAAGSGPPGGADATSAAQQAIAARSARGAVRKSPLQSLLSKGKKNAFGGGGDGGTGGMDIKSSRQEAAALQRMLEAKIRAISDLNQQLASSIVRAQNAEADLNLHRRRLELLSDDYADMGRKLQRLDATVASQKLEKAELVSLLRAAEARAGRAEEEVAVHRAGGSGPRNAAVPRNLALEDLKQVLAVATAQRDSAAASSASASAAAGAGQELSAGTVDQAQVDSLRYMHTWLMDSIRQQEDLRRESAAQAKLVHELRHRAELAARNKETREMAHKSEVFELGHLREENRRWASEVARLKQEVADREEALARMETMHGRLLDVNRSYAADQIQFRDAMAGEFDAAVALKDEAVRQADAAREKADAARAECAHQRAQAVALREDLKGAHALTKRVLADGAAQLAASQSQLEAAQRQLQEFQASLQTEHTNVVDKVKLYLATAAEQRRKKMKRKGGGLVAGLDFDKEDEDGLVVQYYRLSKADLFVKYLLTRNEFKALSDAHAERNVKDAFDLIRRQFTYDDHRGTHDNNNNNSGGGRRNAAGSPAQHQQHASSRASTASHTPVAAGAGGTTTIYDAEDDESHDSSSGLLSSYHGGTSQHGPAGGGLDQNGGGGVGGGAGGRTDDDDGASLMSFDTASTRNTARGGRAGLGGGSGDGRGGRHSGAAAPGPLDGSVALSVQDLQAPHGDVGGGGGAGGGGGGSGGDGRLGGGEVDDSVVSL